MEQKKHTDPLPHSFVSQRVAVITFIKNSYGMLLTPAIGLGATFFSYGTQTNLAGFTFLEAFLASAIVYAVPAQLVLVDQAIVHASIFSVFLSVMLVNMRLMPMTMAVMPKIKSNKLILNVINAHFIAMTTWLGFLQLDPLLDNYPQIRKSIFYFFFGFCLWTISWIMSTLGYFSRNLVSQEWQLAFVYANPLYFIMLLMGQINNKRNLVAIVLGGLFLPLAVWVSLEWSILLAGLGGGTLAFFFNAKYLKK